MEFHEKLTFLIEKLDATNSELAEIAGIHPSGISRFRRGSRIPTYRNKQFVKLCNALLTYTRTYHQEKAFEDMTGIVMNLSPESHLIALMEWLLSDTLSTQIATIQNETTFFKNSQTELTAEKLGILMEKLKLSNARLAAAVNVDASAISRYRNRQRIPSPELLTQMAATLYERARALGNLDVVTETTGLPLEITGDAKAAIDFLVTWLGGIEGSESYRAIASFLKEMDAFTPVKFPPLPELSHIAPETVVGADKTEYWGISGLREAVVRFLGGAARLPEPTTLLLYSDQNMEWMIGDPDYRKRWAALMVYTIRNKNRIKIIHHIDRALPEMVRAIEGWLPLYMSGQLEAYVHKKDLGERFAHTLFISPGQEAVVVAFPKGMEAEACYDYITGEKTRYYEKQHERLLDGATPIVQMFLTGDSQDLALLQGELADKPGVLSKLLSAPSIGTMSVETLELILGRLGLAAKLEAKIRAHHKAKQNLYRRALAKGNTIIEYVYCGGRERNMTISLNLEELFIDEELVYTPRELYRHLEDMTVLAETHGNYRYREIEECLFDNLQILVKEHEGALVFKKDAISVISGFWHARMGDAYLQYINALMEGLMVAEHGWK